MLRLLRRVVPMTAAYDGDRLLARERRPRVATPLLAALVLVATFDVIFAVDSIPAIFAITRETFIVFAANAFSLLGLVGALLRARRDDRPLPLPQRRPRRRCSSSSALKMTLADVWHVPVYASLGRDRRRRWAPRSLRRSCARAPRARSEAAHHRRRSLMFMFGVIATALAILFLFSAMALWASNQLRHPIGVMTGWERCSCSGSRCCWSSQSDWSA